MSKQEAAQRISMFLKMLFETMGALEVGFAITKDNKIMIIDDKTGLSKTFTPTEFAKVYKKWESEK